MSKYRVHFVIHRGDGYCLWLLVNIRWHRWHWTAMVWARFILCQSPILCQWLMRWGWQVHHQSTSVNVLLINVPECCADRMAHCLPCERPTFPVICEESSLDLYRAGWLIILRNISRIYWKSGNISEQRSLIYVLMVLSMSFIIDPLKLRENAIF